LAAERQRGRGWHKGDTHELMFPYDKIPRSDCGFSGDGIEDSTVPYSSGSTQEYKTPQSGIEDSTVPYPGEIGDSTVRNRGLYSPQTPALTSGNSTPKGIDTGLDPV
jgi:hypothetical protein